MAIRRLPIAAKITNRLLADAVLSARILWLAQWSDSQVIGLINVIEHILNTGRKTFPAFAKDDLLTLTENLNRKGHRQLAALISEVGAGAFWSGLTLLATAKGQRDIALIAGGKVLAAGAEEAAEKHYKHIHRQRSNARASGKKSQDKVAPVHAKVREEILRLRNAGYSKRSIGSTLARRDGMPSESTIRRIRNAMDDQEK